MCVGGADTIGTAPKSLVSACTPVGWSLRDVPITSDLISPNAQASHARYCHLSRHGDRSAQGGGFNQSTERLRAMATLFRRHADRGNVKMPGALDFFFAACYRTKGIVVRLLALPQLAPVLVNSSRRSLERFGGDSRSSAPPVCNWRLNGEERILPLVNLAVQTFSRPVRAGVSECVWIDSSHAAPAVWVAAHSSAECVVAEPSSGITAVLRGIEQREGSWQ